MEARDTLESPLVDDSPYLKKRKLSPTFTEGVVPAYGGAALTTSIKAEASINHERQGASSSNIPDEPQDIPNPCPQQRYRILDSFLGEGTYGKVVKATDLREGRVVAIKKVRILAPDKLKLRGNSLSISEVGMHFTTLREIKIMREILHPNIMGVLDVYIQQEYLNLVMEVMETDLRKILHQKILLTESHIKCVLHQILSGLAELHKWNFVHRDLSTANVFLNKAGICKVADFGLSRSINFSLEATSYYKKSQILWNDQLTNKVVTLWYRSPELLFGARRYGQAIDMWSVGCIFGELLKGAPLFPGQNEIDQLSRIFAVCGTPSSTNWPGCTNLPAYVPFTFKIRRELSEVFPGQNTYALNLLDGLLQLDPLRRTTAQAALGHPYFSQLPLACSPKELPLDFLHF